MFEVLMVGSLNKDGQIYDNKMILSIFAKHIKVHDKMNVYKPEIAELLLLVEKKYARPLRTTTDLDGFSYHLKLHLGEVISTSTLKRLWGYVSDNHTPRAHTLDLLSRYVGHEHFCAFCLWLKSSTAYNSSFFTARQVLSHELPCDAEVEIGWAPNRYLRLRYRGNALFEVMEAKQSKLHEGDCFETSSFLIGQPLSLPYILRDGVRTSPFIAGRNGGLTLLNCLNSGK